MGIRVCCFRTEAEQEMVVLSYHARDGIRVARVMPWFYATGG